MNDIGLDDIPRFERELLEFLHWKAPEQLLDINKTGVVSDRVMSALKKQIDAFKDNWKEEREAE